MGFGPPARNKKKVASETWWTFRIFFIFFWSGRGKGEFEAPGGGGFGFLLKIPGGRGFPGGGGGEGPGGCVRRIGEFFCGGGGLNIFFFRGRNVHQGDCFQIKNKILDFPRFLNRAKFGSNLRS